jgi:hypothetical protein
MEPLKRFFFVAIKAKTYLNLVYLILAFPLGLAYFIFSVVGIALGMPLTILFIGFFILAIVVLGWWVFASFERLLAIWLLQVDIGPMEKPGPRPQDAWEKLVDLLTNPVTWKSLIYLILKFPLGIISLVTVVALVGISMALLISPLTFWWLPTAIELTSEISWVIDTFMEAALAFVAGLLIAVVSLHLLNYLAYVSGLWAQLMLGNPRQKTAIVPVEATGSGWQPAVSSPIEGNPEMVSAANIEEPATEEQESGDDEPG